MVCETINRMKKRKISFWEYWFDSPKGHSHQETVDEQMASLIPARTRHAVDAACAIFEMVKEKPMNEQRCPKCGHHSFRRVDAFEKDNPSDSDWRCFRCGNDTDEFGSKL
jgi:hypothetical protein